MAGGHFNGIRMIRIASLTLSGLLLFSQVSSAAITCEGSLATPSKNESHLRKNQPSLENVVIGLNLLTPEEAETFYETSWGGADQLTNEPGDLYGYRKAIRDSYKKPQAYFNKMNHRMGGIAVYQGNVFAEAFYKMHPEPFRDLMKKQAWLRWDEKNKKFIPERGNPASLLLQNYIINGKITLYRGLSLSDLQSMQKAQKGGSTEFDALFAQRDVLFFSPDLRVVETWATEGKFIEVQINVADLDNVYAGIESDYVEVALLPSVVKNVLPNMIVHSTRAKKIK